MSDSPLYISYKLGATTAEYGVDDEEKIRKVVVSWMFWFGAVLHAGGEHDTLHRNVPTIIFFDEFRLFFPRSSQLAFLIHTF